MRDGAAVQSEFAISVICECGRMTPADPSQRPSREALAWHAEQVFV